MHRAMIEIGDIVRAQATFLGYADCFAFLGIVLMCALGVVAMLRKGAAAGGGAH
jgi:DHA2 family multidrug resistance protein